MNHLAALFELNLTTAILYFAVGVTALTLVIVAFVVLRFGVIWLQARMSDVSINMLSLIGMSLRRVNPRLIVTSRIMGVQAGLDMESSTKTNTDELEAHVLAGGNVMRVMQAMIAARQAGLNLGFDQAAAIDLAGRDVLEAVKTSILPKVIDCPPTETEAESGPWLSAVAQDGIELRVNVRVTVRTCLDQLIGGATEMTIVARVGQGIISAIGSAKRYSDVLLAPDKISKAVIAKSLSSNTAFEIVSIDIAKIEVGNNIGARLQSEQAEADTRMARAEAEARRAAAIALEKEMSADVAQAKARYVEAEATIPRALAEAFRAGQYFGADSDGRSPNLDIFRPAI